MTHNNSFDNELLDAGGDGFGESFEDGGDTDTDQKKGFKEDDDSEEEDYDDFENDS